MRIKCNADESFVALERIDCAEFIYYIVLRRFDEKHGLAHFAARRM